MKKIYLTAAFIAASFSIYQSASAQVSIHINLGGSRPQAQPIIYDNADEYYYYPDLNVYFNLASHRYMYMDGNHWLNATQMPVAYRNYNMNNMRRVSINQHDAYLQNDRHRQLYNNGRNEYARGPVNNNNRDRNFDNRGGKMQNNDRNNDNRSNNNRGDNRNSRYNK